VTEVLVIWVAVTSVGAPGGKGEVFGAETLGDGAEPLGDGADGVGVAAAADPTPAAAPVVVTDMASAATPAATMDSGSRKRANEDGRAVDMLAGCSDELTYVKCLAQPR
jgi:hypothetical protein